MVAVPCFASCIHSQNGDCHMNVIGRDRLSEKGCQCEFYRPRNHRKEDIML